MFGLWASPPAVIGISPATAKAEQILALLLRGAEDWRRLGFLRAPARGDRPPSYRYQPVTSTFMLPECEYRVT